MGTPSLTETAYLLKTCPHMMPTYKTPLYKKAEAAEARFGSFWNWTLPRVYSSVAAEYDAANNGVVINDSSYVGRLKAVGEDVLDLLNRISTNKVDSLKPEQGAPTVLTNEKGRIIDLISLFHVDDYILLFTGPSASDRVGQWIDKYTIIEDITLTDITDCTVMLSLFGPDALKFFKDVTGEDISLMPDCSFRKVEMIGSEVSVVRWDIRSLPGIHVIIPRQNAEQIWDMVVARGALPMGMDAFDVLRIEAHFPAYGKELGQLYNPLEAGLEGTISFTKGCYIGQEVIARLDSYNKVQKHLVALEFPAQSVVKEGMPLYLEDQEVGIVTSVAEVPSTGRIVGMGYLKRSVCHEGSKVKLAVNAEYAVEVGSIVKPFGLSAE